MNNTYKEKNQAIIGQRFGKLIVVKQLPSYVHKSPSSSSTRARFECVCDCGKVKDAFGKDLRKGKIKQCSDCAYMSRSQSANRLSNVERSFNLHIVTRCNKSDRIDNFLTVEEYGEIILQDCHYCGEPPRKIDYLYKNRIVITEDFYANGVDRIDSSGHYTIDNCVPCCPQCNSMKMTYTKEEFLSKIEKIYNKWIQQKDLIMRK